MKQAEGFPGWSHSGHDLGWRLAIGTLEALVVPTALVQCDRSAYEYVLKRIQSEGIWRPKCLQQAWLVLLHPSRVLRPNWPAFPRIGPSNKSKPGGVPLRVYRPPLLLPCASLCPVERSRLQAMVRSHASMPRNRKA